MIMNESKSLLSVIPLRDEVLVEITYANKSILEADGSAVKIIKSVVVGTGNFVTSVSINDRVILSGSKFNVINVMDGKKDKLYAIVSEANILYKLDETKITEELEQEAIKNVASKSFADKIQN